VTLPGALHSCQHSSRVHQSSQASLPAVSAGGSCWGGAACSTDCY